MRSVRPAVASVALALLVNVVMVVSADAQQTVRPLRPPSPAAYQ